MEAAPAARKVDAASMTVLPVVTTSSTRTTCLARDEAWVGGKSPAQVAGAFPARESDLRRRAANAAQTRCCESQVQQARHDPRDLVGLVESAFDQPRRVQWHGHEQRRCAPRAVCFIQRMHGHARAEDPRMRERALVLECLHQLRHRKLIGPRRHAPGVGQVERTATRATVCRSPTSASRGSPQRRHGSGTSGISASQSAHRSYAGGCPGRRHRTQRGGSTHPAQRSRNV